MTTAVRRPDVHSGGPLPAATTSATNVIGPVKKQAVLLMAVKVRKSIILNLSLGCLTSVFLLN